MSVSTCHVGPRVSCLCPWVCPCGRVRVRGKDRGEGWLLALGRDETEPCPRERNCTCAAMAARNAS